MNLTNDQIKKMFPESANRIIGERANIRKLVKVALEDGCVISVYDGEEWCLKKASSVDEVMKSIQSTDCDTLRLRKNNEIVGNVFCMYGNSAEEVFADWSDNEVVNGYMERIGY